MKVVKKNLYEIDYLGDFRYGFSKLSFTLPSTEEKKRVNRLSKY